MADNQHGGAQRRGARTGGVVGVFLIASMAIAWLAGALAQPAAADHGGSHAAQGYFLADSGGHMTRFGEAMDTGSLLGNTLRAPIVDGDTTPSGNGSVLVASDGGVFAFGDAPFLGSMAGTPLAAPIVTIEMTSTGRGYLMAAADGGVFAFGDARFRGSLGGLRLNQPIVDMALNATNDGYLLAAADGGVFAFGQSRFRGSMGGRPLNKPIVGILPGETTGYGLVASDGGIFAFGGFVFRGSLGSLTLRAPIVDAVVSSTGDGYNMVASDGGVFAFGDAPFVGSLARLPLPRPIVTILGLGNQKPKAEGDSYSTAEDTVLTRNAASGVLANDTDRDGDTLTAAVATGPSNGTLVLNGDGSFTYTPNANTSGADSFTYTVSDPHGKRDTATVSITVDPVNDAPVAVNDAATTNEDTAVVVPAPGVLGNDTDVEGSPLTATVVAGPAKGTLTLNANGSYTYTPNANTNGADSFTYRANDGTANSNVATVTLTVTAVNDAPVAVNDARTTNEDTVLNVAAPGVLGNDTDVEGSPLTAALVSGPGNGTLTLNANGSFSYTPNANYNGADSFTYRANDGTANSNVATVTLTVTAANDAPVAVNDAHATNEDTPLVVPAPGVLGNDTDVEGSALTAAVVAGPTKGTLTLNTNGSFTYTPNANTNGADSFTYRANDGTANSNTATVSLTVNAVNDAPVAVNDAHTTSEDTPLNVSAPGVLANDSDVEGSALTAALVAGPTKGTLTLNSNGSFTYTPNANTNGADSFTYRANDGTANSNTATVSLTVTAVNDAPVAGDDTFATNEDTALNGNVLTNDSDLDGHSLSISSSTSPSHGTLTLNATTGAFTYTPNANYNGADSFTYTVSDGNGGTDTALVSITVNAVNDAPVAVNDNYVTNEDTPLVVSAPGVLANDSDVEGSPITAVLVAGPTKGTLTLNASGSFTYTPNANTNGADSFTYKASDGVAQGNTATVSLTVTAVNDAPTAVNDSYSTNEDTPLNVVAPGVLANDTDVEGSALTAALVAGPTKGTVTLNTNGSFTYTPNANTNGADSFTYRANDGTANSNTATVSLTVNAVNDAPTAVNDSYSTNEDTPLNVSAPGVLANDSDVEGSALTAALVAGPTKGTLTLNANGSFTYTPNANTNGADSFTYRANDGTANSNTATVSLTVNAVNDAPVAVNDSYSTDEDTALNVVAPGVLANDTDVEGPKSAVLVSGPAHGTLTLNANGSFSYMPTANYHGADSFTYKVNDGAADSGVATVALTVNSVNDAPIAVNDAYSTGEDTPLTVPAPGVLVNDSDIESAVTAVLGTGPSHGTLTLNANGSFTYTPAANYAGADSFTYRASDGTAQSNLATVSLTVNGANDAPTAVNDAYSTDEDLPLNVVAPAVLANDSDADGNSLTAVLVTGPTKGSLTLNANGSFSYAPNANTNGVDAFTYKANDGTADSNTATVTITVNAVNDAPIAVDDAYSTNEDTPVVVSAPGVLANDTDVEGPLSATSFGDAVNGSVTGNADGSFTFTPTANFSGTASFGYTVSDGTVTDTGAVTITVNPVNDAPVATNDGYSTDEDLPLNVVAPAVLANDSDADGNSLTAVLVNGPSNGTLTLNANGSFSYAPNANYNGADSFTYKANDGTVDSTTATVVITVNAVGDAPSAADDGPYNTLQNTNLTLAAPGVLGNDTDADGQALTAGNASDPANGTVTLNPNGSFSYDPDTGFTGTDTFTYDASDGTATDSGTVTINVNPPNATPTADATSKSGNEDGGAITVTLTGHDADGDALTFTAGTAGNGVVTVPSGTSCDANTPSTCTATVTYTPNANFNGSDSFTYKVNDGTVDSAAATVSMTIDPVNDEPSFTKGGNQAVNEDAGAQTVNGWATAISAGPANESGQTVAFTVTTDNDGLFSTLPAVSSAGNLTYTAAANANGLITVSVTAVDNGGTANGGDDTSATQTFTITVTAVNDAPSFTKGSDQTVNEDAGAQSISNWASAISKGPGDESAQTLLFAVSNDNNALFSVQPSVTETGTLVYTTAPNIYGSATVTISLSDNGGTANGGDDTSDSQTFAITVNAVNDAPVAAAKAFDVQTNMKRSVTGLLTGATDPGDVAGDASWSPTYTVGSVTAGAGCVGCTISNIDNANGSFDFEPPAGGTGTYTVTYTVVDSGHPAPGVASAAQTITFTVSGPVIWFADASSGNDTTGTGTLTRPFATLTKVATVDAAGHRVFVHPGTYAAGMSLTNNEWIVGAGTKATSFDDFMGISPPSGTAARPAVNGTNPTVQSSVALGADNTVRGLTLTGANALTGTSFGTLTTGVGSAADVVLNSTGQALSLTTGTITGDFVSTTSSGGTDNVFLSGVNTTTATSLGTGALSSATSEGFQVVGGTGTFTYAGTVANAAGTTVSIANKTGGTVTFNGAVSDSAGAGVSLTTNTGATVAFNGGVTLTSGASPAFVATGGGTVSVTGAANTLASTTGTALNVANTTIGASDLTFRSISANGAANGIVLNSTGSAGNLAVTGTSTTLGSGGTIQNTSGDGISLTNTRDVSLANVDVTNANGHGIRGLAVTNLTLTRAQVTGAGDADNEHGVYLSNTSGTLAVTAGKYSDATETLLLVENSNTNVTVNVTGGTTFSSIGGTHASQAIQLTPNGSSAITATVTNATFTNIKSSSLLVGSNDGLGSGTSTVTFANNTVTSGSGFAGGVLVSGQDNTTTVLTVNGNTFTGAGGDGVVTTDANDNSLIRGTITNNTFTNPVTHAIVGYVDETADSRLLIESNSISNAGADGILLTNFGDDSPAGSVSTAHFIVRNNTITGHSKNPAVANAGAIVIFNFDGDGDTTCAAVSGNNVTGTPSTYFDIYLQDNGGVGTFKFQESPDTAGTGDVTESYIHSLNPGTTLANHLNMDAEFSNGATCTTP